MTEPAIVHENLRTPGKRRAPRRHTARFAAVGGSIPSPNYSSRGGTKVTGVVIHSAEGLTDANALGNYFARASVQASSHVGIDDTKTVAYVDPAFEAWTLRNGNPWTDNAEMCAFAAWTRDQWLAHPGMLQQAAAWVAERCHARNVPPNRLTPADIKAGRRSGYFAHWDYTQATGDGTHWDVGTGFPWDFFGGLVQAAYNGTSEEDDFMSALTPDQQGEIYSLVKVMANRLRGDTAFPDDSLQRALKALDTIQSALIGGNVGGANNFHWADKQEQGRFDAINATLNEIRASLAALTPPAATS